MLTAAAIRPDYRSGRSYRHIVISGGQVRALTDTAAQAARAAGPSASWVDLGPACVGPGFIDTHVHALQAAADVRLVSLRQAATLGDLLAAVREGALRRAAGEWTVSGRNWHESSCARAGCRPGPSLTRSVPPGRSCCAGGVISRS